MDQNYRNCAQLFATLYSNIISLYSLTLLASTEPMCYNAEAAARKLIDYAKQRGNLNYVAQLEQFLKDLESTKEKKFFVNGYARPKLIGFSMEEPMKPRDFQWGFVPKWVKNSADINKQMKLNAKVETMFEIEVFKESALKRRCLIYLDAFYEYHSYKKNKYPFRVTMREDVPLIMGGIWRDWVDYKTGEVQQSVALVTTEANTMMAKIHNEPAASATPRMPVILTKAQQDGWLIDIRSESDIQFIKNLAKPLDDDLMIAYTVARPTGKEGLGNVKEIENEFKYSDLDYTDLIFK